MLDLTMASMVRHPMVTCRGSFEWSGDYSDDSSLWSAALKASVDHATRQQATDGGGTPLARSSSATKAKDDGSFWMSWLDFVKYFSEVGMCNPWLKGQRAYTLASCWEAGLSAGGPIGFKSFRCNQAFALEITARGKGRAGDKEEVSVSVTLSQDDIRGVDDQECFDLCCE
jgi:hypothetical protein